MGRVAIALLLAAEALAFYTFGEVVMRILPEPGNQLVSAPAFVVVGYLAFLLPSAFDWFAIEGGKRIASIGVLGLVVLYGAMRIQYAGDLYLWDFGWLVDFVTATGTVRDWVIPVMTSTVLLVVTWARSGWRSRSGIWLETAPRSLAIPFALVTIALLVSAGSELSEIVTRAGVVFYGIALAGLATSQLAQSGSGIGGLRSGGVTTLMLAGTAAFAVLGVILIGIVLEPLLNVLTPPAAAGGKAIAWFLTYAFFYPIAWVITHILEFILSFLGGDGEPPQIDLPEPPVEVREAAGQDVDEGESLAERAARWGLAAGAIFLGIVGVAAVVFILAMLRRRDDEDAAAGSEAEHAGNLGDDLRDAARSLFRRDRGRGRPTGEGVVRLYQEVLASADRAGKPRAASQTPHEFAPILLSAFHRDVTDDITAAFEYARYSGRPPTEADLADLRRRWEQRG